MSLEQKSSMTWQPTADITALTKRAELIRAIRQFFAERDVIEVDTPVLSHATITDPHVVGIPAIFKNMGEHKEKTLFLQTSPEYAMKRLLAAGMKSIYQINKAFRQGEVGKLHNPEFTILEWYREDFDHHQLMDEMDELLQLILNVPAAYRVSYEKLFQEFLDLNPHTATIEEVANCVTQHNISFSGTLKDKDSWLDLLWTHLIEPRVGLDRPIFLYDFPASQAALAKIRNENPPVASRFEVYFKGVELANGFHELQDAREQENRFQKDLAFRQDHGLPLIPVDERFLAALQHGLPECSGVALGIDRLIMLALGRQSVAEVISFGFERA